MTRIIILLLLPFFSVAQNSANLEKIIAEIDLSQDTARGIYDWMTDNIKYDVKELKRVEEANKKRGKKTKKSQQEWEESLLKSVIKKKKGVCQGYSLLFDAIAKELGLPSAIVTGYVKDKDGKILNKIGHAWNAIKTDGRWILVDATWGAGYINERGKFIKANKDYWYDVDPTEMIKRHMPYDPLWQLLEKPVSYAEFKNNEIEEAILTIAIPEDIDQQVQLTFAKSQLAAIERSEKFEYANSLTKRWRKFNSKNLEVKSDLETGEIFNVLNESMTQYSDEFNTYLKKGRKKQFKGKKWTSTYSLERLKTLAPQVEQVIEQYDNLDVNSRSFRKVISKNKSQAKKLLRVINKEIDFLERS